MSCLFSFCCGCKHPYTSTSTTTSSLQLNIHSTSKKRRGISSDSSFVSLIQSLFKKNYTYLPKNKINIFSEASLAETSKTLNFWCLQKEKNNFLKFLESFNKTDLTSENRVSLFLMLPREDRYHFLDCIVSDRLKQKDRNLIADFLDKLILEKRYAEPEFEIEALEKRLFFQSCAKLGKANKLVSLRDGTPPSHKWNLEAYFWQKGNTSLEYYQNNELLKECLKSDSGFTVALRLLSAGARGEQKEKSTKPRVVYSYMVTILEMIFYHDPDLKKKLSEESIYSIFLKELFSEEKLLLEWSFLDYLFPIESPFTPELSKYFDKVERSGQLSSKDLSFFIYIAFKFLNIRSEPENKENRAILKRLAEIFLDRKVSIEAKLALLYLLEKNFLEKGLEFSDLVDQLVPYLVEKQKEPPLSISEICNFFEKEGLIEAALRIFLLSGREELEEKDPSEGERLAKAFFRTNSPKALKLELLLFLEESERHSALFEKLLPYALGGKKEEAFLSRFDICNFFNEKGKIDSVYRLLMAGEKELPQKDEQLQFPYSEALFKNIVDLIKKYGGDT